MFKNNRINNPIATESIYNNIALLFQLELGLFFLFFCIAVSTL